MTPFWARAAVNGALSAAALAGCGLSAYAVSQAGHYLSSPVRAAVYLGVPAAAAVCAAAALCLPFAARAVIAAAGAAAAAGAYGAEAALRLSADARAEESLRWPVALERRRAGLDAYPAVFPAHLLRTTVTGALESPVRVDGAEILPLGGLPGVRTILCRESAGFIEYDSDGRGFANPPGPWPPAPVDVLIIGDSFAQGYCVAPERSFAGLIRKVFPGLVNLGMSGSGPLIELAGVREFAPRLAPRRILWFFFEGNDIPGNLSAERRSPLLMRYVRDPAFLQPADPAGAAALASLRAVVDADLAARAAGADTMNAGSFQAALSFTGLSKLRGRLGLAPSYDVNTDDLFFSVMRRAAEAAGAAGAALTFVYLPGRAEDYEKDIPAQYETALSAAAAAGLPVVDLRAVFARHPDPVSLFAQKGAGHYNEKGHALAAEHVIAHLMKKEAP